MTSASTITASAGPDLSEEDFARIRSVFAEHVQAGAGGMAFCVYREGRPLLQCYGGMSAPEDLEQAEGTAAQEWDQATLAVLFSGTKGIMAVIAAILMERGLLDPQAPVCSYWSEFAAAGKERVTVAQVLSHTVGLVYPDPAPAPENRYDNRLVAQILAAQEPLWEPGTLVAYHAITYGYLVTELFFRVTGKQPGELVQELLAEPYGLDLFLGLPEAEDHRLATIFRAQNYAISTFLTDPERRKIVERMYGDTLLAGEDPFNSVPLRRAQMAAGGGIGSADAMAKLYSLLVSPDEPIVSADTLQLSTTTFSEGVDAINDRPLRFGLGFELADPLGTYGPVAPAFGHSGAGGGLHGAWPGKNLGFSLLINEMQSEDRDRRAKDLLAALARIF
ncbi:esterase [Glutamicibacter uratoxydans]|uniref:Esterase n=1 Tax=Glutamicibacter uratoxydans TaxID=43667 RepID=A0A4Y4DPS3_GLUUR|nr:serine hydrolase domain-containing protein [Glutamicibacter uratoxydans]GED05884.1 esterase [Glutamicibacter uratoxydans]